MSHYDDCKIIRKWPEPGCKAAKEYRFQGDEVLVNKIGDVVLLMPKGDKWSGFLSALNLFSDDFMEEGRGETAGQEREEL